MNFEKKMAKEISRKMLARDESRNFQIDKICLAPNAKLSPHFHPDVEWIFVLRGEFIDERGTFRAGDFFVNERDSVHTVCSGAKGCDLLCCWCGRIEEVLK